MKWHWPPWGCHPDTTDEALAALAELERRAPEVTALSTALRAAQRRNHFSPMVSAAISRAREA